MDITITILIIAVLSFLYILITPLNLSVRYEFLNKRTVTRVKFFPFDYRSTSEKGKKRAVKREKRRKRGIQFQHIYRIFRDEFDTVSTVFTELFTFIRKIPESLDRYYINIFIKGGLGPPDLTGEVYGAIESMKPGLGKSITVVYEPDFFTDSMQGSVLAGLELRIISIVKIVLKLIWRLPKVRLIKILYLLRKGGTDAEQT